MSDDNYTQQKNKIVGFYERHKRLPGYAEIMTLVGFKSKNAVYKLINKLVDEGVVDKDSRGKLTPTRSFTEVPMLGLVEAGIPTSAEEYVLDSINIDNYLIRRRESTYIVEVKGDSMIEAGIHEGDLVVVERSDGNNGANAAKEGDIVVAEVDGGWTMKYYRKDAKGRPYLQPANKDFKNIYPEYDLKVAAIVRGVVRRY